MVLKNQVQQSLFTTGSKVGMGSITKIIYFPGDIKTGG
jgi:hypothetical protein